MGCLRGNDKGWCVVGNLVGFAARPNPPRHAEIRPSSQSNRGRTHIKKLAENDAHSQGELLIFVH
jgi:hypothetical protein